MESHNLWVGGDARNDGGNQFVGNAFSNSTLNIINSQATNNTKQEGNESYREKLLESLEYTQIRRGRGDIDEPHEDTCQWIFHEPFDFGVPETWSSFSAWLRSGSGIYWVQGKAGSGKSTLLNYICDHPRTKELLSYWSNGREVATPTFFFWNSGTDLQKSIVGLLRSLIYQIVLWSFPEQSTEEDPLLQTILQSKPFTGEWQEKQLIAALLKLLERQNQESSGVYCFFIDGLDEFSGSWLSLARELKRISTYDNVKLCVSSRPENSFQTAFLEWPSLRTQDFTLYDMKRFIFDQLSTFPVTEQLNDKQMEELHGVVDLVAQKAEGVWQWVVVSLPEIVDSRINLDNPQQLLSRLEQLPPSLTEMYARILGRVNPAYQKLSTRVLNIILMRDKVADTAQELRSFGYLHSFGELKFVDVAFPSLPFKDPTTICFEDILSLTSEAVCSHYKTRRLQWNAACMGLIEFREPKTERSLRRDDHEYYHDLNFGFIHKTVQEFVEQYVKMGASELDDLRLEVHYAIIRSSLWRTALYLASIYPTCRSALHKDQTSLQAYVLPENQLPQIFIQRPADLSFLKIAEVIAEQYSSDDAKVPKELDQWLKQVDYYFLSNKICQIMPAANEYFRGSQKALSANDRDWMALLAGRDSCSFYIKSRFKVYQSRSSALTSAKYLQRYAILSIEDISVSSWVDLTTFLISHGLDPHELCYADEAGRQTSCWRIALKHFYALPFRSSEAIESLKMLANFLRGYIKRDMSSMALFEESRSVRFADNQGGVFKDSLRRESFKYDKVEVGCYTQASPLVLLEHALGVSGSFEEGRSLIADIKNRGGKREVRLDGIDLDSVGGKAGPFERKRVKERFQSILLEEWEEEWTAGLFFTPRDEHYDLLQTRVQDWLLTVLERSRVGIRAYKAYQYD